MSPCSRAWNEQTCVCSFLSHRLAFCRHFNLLPVDTKHDFSVSSHFDSSLDGCFFLLPSRILLILFFWIRCFLFWSLVPPLVSVKNGIFHFRSMCVCVHSGRCFVCKKNVRFFAFYNAKNFLNLVAVVSPNVKICELKILVDLLSLVLNRIAFAMSVSSPTSQHPSHT